MRKIIIQVNTVAIVTLLIAIALCGGIAWTIFEITHTTLPAKEKLDGMMTAIKVVPFIALIFAIAAMLINLMLSVAKYQLSLVHWYKINSDSNKTDGKKKQTLYLVNQSEVNIVVKDIMLCVKGKDPISILTEENKPYALSAHKAEEFSLSPAQRKLIKENKVSIIAYSIDGKITSKLAA